MTSPLLRRLSAIALGAAATLAGPQAGAKDLLRATVEDGMEFSLSGESRQDVMGGELVLGERRFKVTGVSRHGLIGASRVVHAADGGAVRFGEYAVFSSSFSDRTATGNPWTEAAEYHRCDEAYNSFLTVYHVEGEAAVKALGPQPYGQLTDDPASADKAVVYCFMSRPPEG